MPYPLEEAERKCFNMTTPTERILRHREMSKAYYYAHKEQARINNKHYREIHRQERAAEQVKIRAERKLIVIRHYSPNLTCQRCGFNDMRALSIDHIHGKGTKERKNRKLAGQIFYHWIIKNNFPDDLQVLCMNCQWIKRFENHELNQYVAGAVRRA